MSQTSRTSSVPLLGRLFQEGTSTGLSDADLASRFVKTRDPEAFAALVIRHGPMVMAVCRGSLGPQGDADDAFQATFLVLLNRLGTINVGPSLGGWLYRVARRVCRQALLAENRRRKRESAAIPSVKSPTDPELLETIRREVNLLPERYRAPIMLCDLQGLTRSQAAEVLGCPEGTIGVRIARGRQKLRERLERQGASPVVPLPLPGGGGSIEAAVRAASLLGSGKPATPAAIALASRVASSLAVKGGVVLVFIAASITAALIAANVKIEVEPPKGQTPS